MVSPTFFSRVEEHNIISRPLIRVCNGAGPAQGLSELLAGVIAPTGTGGMQHGFHSMVSTKHRRNRWAGG